MSNDDPFPDFPDEPKGLDLHEGRRWVSMHALKIHRWRVRRCKLSGNEWMKWMGVEEEATCESCRTAHGKVMHINEVDVDGHYAACTCNDGCACFCCAIMGPESTTSADAENYGEIIEAYRIVMQASYDRYALDENYEEHKKLWTLTLDDVLRLAREMNE